MSSDSDDTRSLGRELYNIYEDLVAAEKKRRETQNPKPSEAATSPAKILLACLHPPTTGASLEIVNCPKPPPLTSSPLAF
jgi:hypothetical protein